LLTAREEEDDARRRDEGAALAQALLLARQQVQVNTAQGERALQWRDIMLLVKKRKHLSAYVKCVRGKPVFPFVSGQALGGLLESLESSDLMPC